MPKRSSSRPPYQALRCEERLMKRPDFRPILMSAMIIAWSLPASAQRTRSLTSASMRVALLIGINRYSTTPNALQGSGTDVSLTKKMLQSRGFAPILTLSDTEATAQSIQKALDTLGRSQPQDV